MCFNNIDKKKAMKNEIFSSNLINTSLVAFRYMILSLLDNLSRFAESKTESIFINNKSDVRVCVFLDD